jgi:hypothetical protein
VPVDAACGVQAEDANQGYMYGMQTLFRFYSYGLEASWNAGRFRDFQHAVLQDLARQSTYGLEKVTSTAFPLLSVCVS